MQTIMKTLEASANAIVQSSDDVNCRLFLSSIGILQDLRKSDTPNLCVISTGAHKTHWVVAALWSGYDRPEENGYRVFCFPKGLTTPQRLDELVEELYRLYRGHSREKATLHKPDDFKRLN